MILFFSYRLLKLTFRAQNVSEFSRNEAQVLFGTSVVQDKSPLMTAHIIFLNDGFLCVSTNSVQIIIILLQEDYCSLNDGVVFNILFD